MYFSKFYNFGDLHHFICFCKIQAYLVKDLIKGWSPVGLFIPALFHQLDAL